MKENTTGDGRSNNGLTENYFTNTAIPLRTEVRQSIIKELSRHFAKMKIKGIEYPIMNRSVIDHAKPYTNGSKGATRA